MIEPPTRTQTHQHHHTRMRTTHEWFEPSALSSFPRRRRRRRRQIEREEKKKSSVDKRGTNNGHEDEKKKKGRRFWENEREKKLNSAHIPRLYLRNRLRRTRRLITSSGIIHVCVHLLHHSRLRAGSSGGRATTTSVAHLWSLDFCEGSFSKMRGEKKTSSFQALSISLSLNFTPLLQNAQ